MGIGRKGEGAMALDGGKKIDSARKGKRRSCQLRPD
jgi:hypothetical protein